MSHCNVGGGGGGSGYIGGCILGKSYTIAGLSGLTISKTLPAGLDDVSYVSGSNVGTGGGGSTSASIRPESGGPGRILITLMYVHVFVISGFQFS